MALKITRARAAIAAGVAALVLIAGGLAAMMGLPGAWFAADPTAAPTVSATLTPSPTPRTPRPTASPIPTPTPAPTPTPSPTPAPFDEALLEQRVTVLILGRDQNRFRRARGVETNTDAMVVASISADHTHFSTLSLPRDTVDWPLADGSVWTNKANQISRYLGIEALRGSFETALGIDIDYYVQVDMDDFAWMVNTVGGIDVEVPYDIFDAGSGFYYAAGVQHLTGEQALIYARTRSQDGDYARQLRQQQILVALWSRLTDAEADIDLVELLPAMPSIETDIPMEKIPTLIELARRSRGAQVSHQVLGPPQYAVFEGLAGVRGWVMIPNIEAMRAYAQSVMGSP